MESFKKNEKGNFEVSGVEFNGYFMPSGQFRGRCITEGWRNVDVIGWRVNPDNNDEIAAVNFCAAVQVFKVVSPGMDRADMAEIHAALCPGFDWK